MKEPTGTPSSEQQMYWREFVQLKADTFYLREYRSSLSRWVTAMATLRAITSASSIGGWLVWKKYALLWAGLIALTQLADALKDVFPVYKRRRALSRWLRTLNRLFVDAQRNWDNIASGVHTETQIRKLSHQLRSRKNRAEETYLPDGLARRPESAEKAKTEADDFFRSRYNQKVRGDYVQEAQDDRTANS